MDREMLQMELSKHLRELGVKVQVTSGMQGYRGNREDHRPEMVVEIPDLVLLILKMQKPI